MFRRTDHPVKITVATTLFAVLWSCGNQTLAQQCPADAADVGRTDQVIIRTADGKDLRGDLHRFSLSTGAVMRTEAGDSRRIRTEDLVVLETKRLVQPPLAGDVAVSLAGGDVLYGRLSGTLPDGLRLKTTDIGTLELPLESVVSVELFPGGSRSGRQNPGKAERNGAERDDAVLLRNGDLLRGFVLSLDAEQVSLEQGTDTVRVSMELAAAIYLAAAEPPDISDLHSVATLTHSGHVTLTELDWQGDSIEARSPHGPKVRLPGAALVKLDILGGRWEWLTQYQPMSFEHTPMLGLDFGYVADRNVLSGPLTVAGQTFAHGLGVHSRARLVYDLRGSYREFVTEFGLDDNSGVYADVDVMVLVDGKRLLEQPQVRPGKLHGPFRLDVSRGKRLELIVDFGAAGDLQDRLNWINAALVR